MAVDDEFKVKTMICQWSIGSERCHLQALQLLLDYLPIQKGENNEMFKFMV